VETAEGLGRTALTPSLPSHFITPWLWSVWHVKRCFPYFLASWAVRLWVLWDDGLSPG